MYLATRNKWDKWVHEPSGRVYNLCTNPPVSSFQGPQLLDDVTGEPLIQVVTVL
jgi:hypothetical protein